MYALNNTSTLYSNALPNLNLSAVPHRFSLRICEIEKESSFYPILFYPCHRCECRRIRRARVSTGSSRPTRTTSASACTSSGRWSPATGLLCRRPTRRTRATRRATRSHPKRAANRRPRPPPRRNHLKVRLAVVTLITTEYSGNMPTAIASDSTLIVSHRDSLYSLFHSNSSQCLMLL